MKLLNLFKFSKKTKFFLIISVALIIVTTSIITINNKIKLKEKQLTTILNSTYSLKNQFNSLTYKKSYESTYNNLLLDLEESIVNKDLDNSKILLSNLQELYSEASKHSEDITNEKNNIEYLKKNIENFYITNDDKKNIENIILQLDELLSNEKTEELESKYSELEDIYKNCNEHFTTILTDKYNGLDDYLNSKLYTDNYNELIEKDSTLTDDINNIKSKIENVKSTIDNTKPKNNKIFENTEYDDINNLINSIKNDIDNLYENKVSKLLSDILKSKAKEKQDQFIQTIENNGFSPYNIVKNILPEFIEVDKSSDRIVESVSGYHITSTVHYENIHPSLLVWHYLFSDPKITNEGVTYTFELYKYENRFDDDPDNEKNYKLSLNDGKITYLKDGTIKYKNRKSSFTKLQPFN